MDLQAGKILKELAEQESLEYQSLTNLTRNNGELDWQISRAVFSSAKPKGDQPTAIQVGLANGEQVVVNVLSVTEGEPSKAAADNQQLAKTNIARALGQSDFNSVLSALQEVAVITVNESE